MVSDTVSALLALALIPLLPIAAGVVDAWWEKRGAIVNERKKMPKNSR